jgi:hypothetical protein
MKDEAMSNFALEMPALNGDVVTERHARYCAHNGHAAYKGESYDEALCPRCGEFLPSAEAIEKFEAIIDAERTARHSYVSAGFGIDADTRARGMKDWQGAKSTLGRLIDGLTLEELAEYGEYRARIAREAAAGE